MLDTPLAYESPTGVRCARCRAIIDSLPDDAACTNCGLGVGLAKAGLLHADPLWLRPVRRGLLLLGFTPVLSALFVLAAFALRGTDRQRDVDSETLIMLGCPGPQQLVLRLT